MSDNRKKFISKRPSGAEFRKRAKEKDEKRESVLKKVPKIDSFFASSQKVINDDIAVPGPSGIIEDSEVPSNYCLTEPLSHDENETEIVESQSTELTENSTPEVLDKNLDDPFFWEVNEELRDYISKNGLKQNEDADFSKSVRQYPNQKRFFSKTFFTRKLCNGETVKRNWLVYSISSGLAFCGPCKLYGGTTLLATTGYNDWKNFSTLDHDIFIEHRDCTRKFITRMQRSGRVDSEIVKTFEKTITYWKEVLKRVVETIKFLASRGLPFYGENEIIGSSKNGNFLGCIELISKFDPFMADHLARYGNMGKGQPSYLSSTIVNELILQLSGQVRNFIVAEIKRAKYYSIIVDSSPDIAHIDQLTIIIRYVLPNGTPVERFLTFLPNCGHKGEEMEKAILEFIENSLQLNIADCRGQSYDNARNMSGCYKGLQSRIKQLNPLATFVPCAGHSLQLVGAAAAEASDLSSAFFQLVQQLYNFFTPTHRWNILKSKLKPDCQVLKSLSKTRWSARSDASKSLYKSYKSILEALSEIGRDNHQTSDVRKEANGMIKKLQTLEIGIMVCVWNFILNKFQEVTTKIQGVEVDLDCVHKLYSNLQSFLKLYRDENEFGRFEAEAIEKCGTNQYKKDQERKRRPKLPFGETTAGHTEFNGRKSFMVEHYYVTLDTLQAHLEQRQKVYEELNSDFGFLWKLTEMSNDNIRRNAQLLQKKYSVDLEIAFPEECVQLAAFLRDHKDMLSSKHTPQNMLNFLKTMESMFPNIEIILRIFLSMAVTNCSGERSFSVLKRIKNYLRSTLSDDKLCALAILFIENELMQLLEFDNVVEKFAEAKSRKKMFT